MLLGLGCCGSPTENDNVLLCLEGSNFLLNHSLLEVKSLERRSEATSGFRAPMRLSSFDCFIKLPTKCELILWEKSDGGRRGVFNSFKALASN